ncbi:hematological/neurological-like protein [Perilla frutescens var. frutescens]|nr:hematological/neurological-like protein [Perilla frutescens var. frutescens]KAH6782382.1 hematological/neurological-like protein [Perilla frutescens var. frutescens]
MEKSTPVRKPHSTADLLTWSENPPEISPAPASSARSHQPSDGISKVVFGGQVTDEEVESLNKRKPCSGYKMKEMTGSGIFKGKGENGLSETDDTDQTPANKTGLRMYQQTLSGVSHISFGEEETVSPKKPTSLHEVAKQRELSGNLESESEAKLQKQISDAKNKELSGNNIFAPPPEIKPRPLGARALALRESITIGEPTSVNGAGNGASSEDPAIKTAKKIPNQKFSELSGNDIFKGDAPPASAEKPLSSAKLREMSGSNIFADGKVESRDYFGGVRKPPGGESSIALV